VTEVLAQVAQADCFLGQAVVMVVLAEHMQSAAEEAVLAGMPETAVKAAAALEQVTDITVMAAAVLAGR
jgi:hypothetical protein